MHLPLTSRLYVGPPCNRSCRHICLVGSKLKSCCSNPAAPGCKISRRWSRRPSCASALQVEHARRHAIYQGMCQVTVAMASVYAHAAGQLLRAAMAAKAEAQQHSPSLLGAGRVTAALHMLLHVAACCIDGAHMVHCHTELEELHSALEELAAVVDSRFMVRSSGQGSAHDPLTALAEVQLTAGCSAFTQWHAQQQAGTEGHIVASSTDSGRAVSGIASATLRGCGAECARLASTAAAVQWHAGTAESANRWQHIAHQLLSSAHAEQGVHEQHGAATLQELPEQTLLGVQQPERLHSVDSDDLDEVILEPGQGWGGREGLQQADLWLRSCRQNEAAAPQGLDVQIEVSTTLHPSLPAELKLPSSLSLG